MTDASRPPPSYADDHRRMSDAEALMWKLEKDPYLSSNFGTIMILDRRPDFDRLTTRMDRALRKIPRLRWRVQPSGADLGAPTWVEDPDLDLGLHLRHISLPPPGTMRQLFELASMMTLDPFDRTRPLWQFTVIDGLGGGRAAMLTKMHHTISDGINGVRMSMEYLDLDRAGASPLSTYADAPPAGVKCDHGLRHSANVALRIRFESHDGAAGIAGTRRVYARRFGRCAARSHRRAPCQRGGDPLDVQSR